ncbi:MAG: hypothetical protein M9891_01780 [Austwickia sp.]|nr:hypothetical protein [Actinomycetota bacterium]MCB1255125.1 hypothetical protein [Austwickia sp.]MCO5308023.1 hypothetical protein [Austwickia sp.]
MTEAYSQVAWDQLDAMEASDPHRYADTLDLIEDILDEPGSARATADVLTTPHGVLFENFVPDRYPLAVFWSNHPAQGPRIEAFFPHDANRS